MAQWVGHHSGSNRLQARPPVQGDRVCRRQQTDVSLSHRCFSLSLFSSPFPFSLKINLKIFKRKIIRRENTLTVPYIFTLKYPQFKPTVQGAPVYYTDYILRLFIQQTLLQLPFCARHCAGHRGHHHQQSKYKPLPSGVWADSQQPVYKCVTCQVVVRNKIK